MEEWAKKDYEQRMQAEERRSQAATAIQTLLQEHPGPWAFQDLEGKVTAAGEFPEQIVRSALWGMLAHGSLKFGEKHLLSADGSQQSAT